MSQVIDEQVHINISLADTVSINGRISKKLFEKMVVPKIQSLEKEVARLKEENLRMRNWKNCVHDRNSVCNYVSKAIIGSCPCDRWEIRK